jgi:hypothetical protein
MPISKHSASPDNQVRNCGPFFLHSLAILTMNTARATKAQLIELLDTLTIEKESALSLANQKQQQLTVALMMAAIASLFALLF